MLAKGVLNVRLTSSNPVKDERLLNVLTTPTSIRR